MAGLELLSTVFLCVPPHIANMKLQFADVFDTIDPEVDVRSKVLDSILYGVAT